jgi:hypothetical protein
MLHGSFWFVATLLTTVATFWFLTTLRTNKVGQTRREKKPMHDHSSLSGNDEYKASNTSTLTRNQYAAQRLIVNLAAPSASAHLLEFNYLASPYFVSNLQQCDIEWPTSVKLSRWLPVFGSVLRPSHPPRELWTNKLTSRLTMLQSFTDYPTGQDSYDEPR